jgi:GrpB-like predicted nucleotidyltransferase (UPF0157 family)
MYTTRPIQPYTWEKPQFKPYDMAYVLVAADVADLITQELPNVSVEHIGSTAVQGLPGKGIVDLMVVYPQGLLEEVKKVLERLGFQKQPQRNPYPESRPMRVGAYDFMGSLYQLHVHVISNTSPEADELRAFRDRLRYDNNFQMAYSDAKKAILKTGVYDSTDYAERKSEFIERMTTRR